MQVIKIIQSYEQQLVCIDVFYHIHFIWYITSLISAGILHQSLFPFGCYMNIHSRWYVTSTFVPFGLSHQY